MQFKLSPIEIPQSDPFQFDALQRRPSVEAIASLLDNLSGPFVLAIDSQWGTGKTTFVRMLKSFLESQNFFCLYFNAWETDFTTDPLLAFLGEMDGLIKAYDHGGKAFDKAKKIATLIAKRVLPVAGKIATGGLLDLDSFTKDALADLVSDSVTDAVDAYTAEKNLILHFHESLSEAVKSLHAKGKKTNLVVFVDEVDRCRPTFAVELLERIKHLFNVPNILFVISLDKVQLSVSLSSVYGDGINSNEYLRRFIDIEYNLPKPNPKAFTKHLFGRFGFDDFFKDRANSAFERNDIEEVFTSLSDLFDLSLRAREQCFTMLRVAMLMTPGNYQFYPFLLTALIILKLASPSLYKLYALEDGSSSDVVTSLKSMRGGEDFLYTRAGISLEAYLIGAKAYRYNKTAELESYEQLAASGTTAEKDKDRAKQLIDFFTDSSFNNSIPSLKDVVKKIELIQQFKELG
jgi:hypothetical protein